MSASLPGGKVRAWDLPTRLFKWSLVFLVAMAWISNKYGGGVPRWHKWNGYAILVLVVFRLLWGFAGGSTTRFSAFLPTPRRILAYLASLLRGQPLHYLGHNPLGAGMIILLLLTVGAVGGLGLFSADADRLVIEGPLTNVVSDSFVSQASRLHRLGFDLLLVLIGLHVMANLCYDVLKREGLILAMISGAKQKGDYADMRESQPGSWLAALVCLATAVAIVLGGIFIFGDHSII